MSEEDALQRLRIYCSDDHRVAGRPIHEAIVERAQQLGLAGATVLRGVMGFGSDSHIHTAKVLRLSNGLPLIVEVVDRPERIESLLGALEPLGLRNFATLEPVSLAFSARDQLSGV